MLLQCGKLLFYLLRKRGWRNTSEEGRETRLQTHAQNRPDLYDVGVMLAVFSSYRAQAKGNHLRKLDRGWFPL